MVRIPIGNLIVRAGDGSSAKAVGRRKPMVDGGAVDDGDECVDVVVLAHVGGELDNDVRHG